MAVGFVNRNGEIATHTVEVPAPTPWPIVLAFGITLLFAGLVTSEAVSVLGAVVSIAGAAGWFRDVLPHERHESVRVVTEVPLVTTMRPEVARIEIAQEARRAWLPVEIHPISAGGTGGLAGTVAMSGLAELLGLVYQARVWSPINIVAAGVLPVSLMPNTAHIGALRL